MRKLLPLVLILASACSGGSPDASEESGGGSSRFSVADALQPDGPLRGIAFTGHVDPEDPKVDPTLAFTTNDTEVTAVIGIGDVAEGSTVVVTWYRVAGLEEREALFSHEIAVGGAGRAFSQAVAPNGLAPGIYDTEATMDGHVVHTPWVVREAGASGIAATAQAASGDGSGNVPESGNSWWNRRVRQPPDSGNVDRYVPVSIDRGLDASPTRGRDLWWGNRARRAPLLASVQGRRRRSHLRMIFRGRSTISTRSIWVCSLPGGNDMPGTVVHFEATGSASAEPRTTRSPTTVRL